MTPATRRARLWRRIERRGVVGAAVVGLVGSLVVSGLSYWTARQAREEASRALEQARALTATQGDVDLLVRFAEFYGAADHRHRFSVYLVQRMQDPEWRRDLRDFIVRDTMSRRFRESPPARFDGDDPDWTLVAEAFRDRRRDWNDEDEGETFVEWWCRKRADAVARWPKHRETIDALYLYVDEFYFKPDPDLGSLGGCESGKKLASRRSRATPGAS